MSEQTWWKKELYGNVCGTDEAKVILSDIKMYERLEDLCERLEAAAEARGRQEALDLVNKLRLDVISGGTDLMKESLLGGLELAASQIESSLSPTQGSSSQ